MALSNEEIQQVSELVTNRIRNMLARGEVKKVTKGKTTKLKVELLSGEVYDGIEMPNQFGHQFHPPIGSEVIVCFFGGNRSHGSVLAVFNKNYTDQENLEEGESVLYDSSGSKVLVKSDGSIHITPSGGTVYVDGNLVTTGNVTDENGSMQEMRNDYNTHTHGGGSTPLPQMT